MAGAAGLVSACAAGLGASAPHPPRRIARTKKRSTDCSGIFPVRTTPVSAILLRKDGAVRAPLAHVQSLGEVFSIRKLGPEHVLCREHSTSRLSPECRGLPASAALPDAPNSFILTAGGAPWKDSCRHFAMADAALNAARGSRPGVPPCSLPLPTIARCAPRAGHVRWPPPKGTIVGCFRGSWRDIPSDCCWRPSIGGKYARPDGLRNWVNWSWKHRLARAALHGP